MSLALARKYRPATFDDLVGQEAVSQTLSLAITNDRLSHAYLFSGLRGSGKTSTARIFAKALLCEQGATANPCGTCIHCTMAIENNHLDIIEMDAASNRGIDDIKDLIEHTKYKPSCARYKIFIIDEVHMLTNQAFNALLKTLEEPPDFVKFILATTDPLKLPATILSRTQHFRFKKIPQNLILKHLEYILNLEKIEFETAALEILARSGAGSLRDSLTLTDQAIVYSKNFVDLTTVTKMLGIIEPGHLEKLLSDIMLKERSKILTFIHMARDYEAEMILDELTLYLKELLLSGRNAINPMIIERFFRVIADSKNLLSLGSDSEFVLTLALFKMIESLEIKDIDTMIKGLENELKGVEVSKIVDNTPIPDLSIPKAMHTEEVKTVPLDTNTTEMEKETPIPKSDSKVPEIEITQDIQSDTNENKPNQENAKPSYQKYFDSLVKKIYDRDYDLGICFEQNISFVDYSEDKLTWESMAEGDDKKSLINHWGVINMFVKDVFGFETKIVNIPKKKIVKETTSAISETPLNTIDKQIDDTTKLEDIQMKSSCIAPEAGDTESAKEKDPSVILQEPMVKEAIALLNPKKVRIKKNS